MTPEENNKQLQEKMDKIIGCLTKTLYTYNEEERQAMIEHSVLSAFKTKLKGNQLELLTNGLSNAVTEEIEKIKAYPCISGWVARDENGYLFLYCEHPEKGSTTWLPTNGQYMELDQTLFSDLKWPDNPIRVKLPIIRK